MEYGFDLKLTLLIVNKFAINQLVMTHGPYVATNTKELTKNDDYSKKKVPQGRHLSDNLGEAKTTHCFDQ